MDDVVLATVTEDRPVSSDGLLTRLEVADGLLALVVVAAAIIRFVDLGRLPLSSVEAETALAPWRLWSPDGEPGALVSPVYFTLTSLVTQLFGFSDGVMRFTPALFGVAMVGLPWLLKERLGRLGTLTFSLLLAVSPLHSAISRTAGGEAIALFALLLIFVAWLRFRETASQRWLLTLFGALGLGLASAPLFYGGMIAMAVAVTTHAYTGPALHERKGTARLGRQVLQRVALAGGGVFLAASTLFLWYPAGVGSAVQLPVRWLAQFNFQGGVERLIEPLLAIGRYEILLLLPGFAAILWAILRDRPLGTLCVHWMAAIGLLVLLQWGQMDYAVLLTLPGYLLLAEFVRKLLEHRVEPAGLALSGVLLLATVSVFVNLARYSRLALFEPQKLANVWISFTAIVIVLVSLYVVLTWRPEIAYQGALIGTLALLVFYQWGTGWWLAHDAANDPRERWVETGTDQGVRVLVNVIKDISRQTTGSDYGLKLANRVDSPVLSWYLREFSRLQTDDVSNPGEQSPVILSPSQEELALASDYRGADFVLQKSVPRLEPAGQSGWLDSLRWWLFHESNAAVDEQRVLLWWRADLIEELR